MAIINEYGMNIVYYCKDLIAELKEDIIEFGSDKVIAVWVKEMQGVEIITNYDFIEEDMPVDSSELQEGECIKTMTMLAALEYMEKQNSIL